MAKRNGAGDRCVFGKQHVDTIISLFTLIVDCTAAILHPPIANHDTQIPQSSTRQERHPQMSKLQLRTSRQNRCLWKSQTNIIDNNSDEKMPSVLKHVVHNRQY
eukprot:scaffold1214_cov135-Skeletonema_menzelii.AAC.1